MIGNTIELIWLTVEKYPIEENLSSSFSIYINSEQWENSNIFDRLLKWT